MNKFAYVTYKIASSFFTDSLAQEIAIGQSLGCWDTKFVPEDILKEKSAKIHSITESDNYHYMTLKFPYELWFGKLTFLFTLVFGKISFYPNIQLNSIYFSPEIFSENILTGPKHSIQQIRKQVGLTKTSPMLMCILKPNVALDSDKIASLCLEAAEAGVHLIKDDEIRFDSDFNEVLKRTEKVYNEFEKRNLKTIYSVHLQISTQNTLEHLNKMMNSGAKSVLINTYVAGIDSLQEIRKHSDLILLSHPAFAGAFSSHENSPVHPAFTFAEFIRAAGADISLFPSPYGKIGLSKKIVKEIFKKSSEINSYWKINPIIPAPSAGIKPYHGSQAIEDFGNDFILNAGTAIFSNEFPVRQNIQEFQKYLYNENT